MRGSATRVGRRAFGGRIPRFWLKRAAEAETNTPLIDEKEREIRKAAFSFQTFLHSTHHIEFFNTYMEH